MCTQRLLIRGPHYADQLDLDSDGVKALEEINAEEGVLALLVPQRDRRQSYCLIVEVNRISPEMVA